MAGISDSWTPRGNRHWKLTAGIEIPQYSFTTVEGITKKVYQRVPDIPIAAKYHWNNSLSWVRGSAIFRTLTYRNLLQDKNRSCFGYGVQLSGAVAFLDRFTFYWQGVWGRGIGSMVQDTVDEGLDLTPVDSDMTLSPAKMWGGFLALKFDVCDRVTTSVTYSQLRGYVPKYEGGTTEWNNLYKYTQYVCANAFYQPLSFFATGLEYIWGRRVNYDGLKCADNRLQLALQLIF